MNNFLFNRSTKLRPSARIYLGIGLLLLLLLQSAASFAQKITLNYHHVPLELVLKDIRKQSGYDIFFDQTLVSQQPLVVQRPPISNLFIEDFIKVIDFIESTHLLDSQELYLEYKNPPI